MARKIILPRGTADILPFEIARWQELERKSRQMFALYGFKEIRTPLFEETELFARSMGQTSDVVQKQMLNLASQGDTSDKSSFSLRPEGTASVVRSYIQNDLDRKESRSKLFYIGPMFRGERPQKGRLRQFHQIGAEIMGPQTAHPYLDAEMLALVVDLLTSFGVQSLTLKLNSLGTREDKENLSSILREQLQPSYSDLCGDCQSRFNRNVFRILDCKKKSCQVVVDKLKLDYSYLAVESREYFEQVKKALTSLHIPFIESPRLVRGLDYYTHTVFEVTSSVLGSQDALGAGGRYNNLVSELGGSAVDAVGFALGIERIILASGEGNAPPPVLLDGFLIAMGEPAMHQAFKLLPLLRKEGISVDFSYRWNASLKSQMHQADKIGTQTVMILGDNELAAQCIAVKDMLTGEQRQVPLGEIVAYFKQR